MFTRGGGGIHLSQTGVLVVFLEGVLAFDQVPMLEIDGLHLVQTGCITRYIARKAGLYGKTNEDSALYVNEHFISLSVNYGI